MDVLMGMTFAWLLGNSPCAAEGSFCIVAE